MGDINKLYEISDKAIVLPRRMEIVIAQPGLSAAKASTQQLDLLASTQSYLQTTIKAPLTVWCWSIPGFMHTWFCVTQLRQVALL